MVGPIRLTSGLCGDVLEGLGIRSVPKGSRKAIEALADAVERDIRAGARAAGLKWGYHDGIASRRHVFRVIG